MNTRLQVEHSVTEMVTGLDLVALQIAIAAGDPLPFGQGEIEPRGHAIECRVYAEDPRSYLPSTGELTVFEPPVGNGVRNDTAVRAGERVGTDYDAMLAKVLTHGQDRRQALHRMEEALADYRIEGVITNLALLRAVVADPRFRTGTWTVDFLEREETRASLFAGA